MVTGRQEDERPPQAGKKLPPYKGLKNKVLKRTLACTAPWRWPTGSYPEPSRFPHLVRRGQDDGPSPDSCGRTSLRRRP